MDDECEGLWFESGDGERGEFDMYHGLDFGEIDDGPDAGDPASLEPCWDSPLENRDALDNPDSIEHGDFPDNPEWAELQEEATDSTADKCSYLDDPFGKRLEISETSEQFEKVMEGINPGYDPFSDGPRSTNCGACAIALEARLSGVDPEAAAGLANIGTAEEMERITGMLQASASPGEIENHARFMGPGYHSIVGFDRAESQDGHWFNVAVSDNGRVFALDSQCGIAMPFDEYIKAYARDGVNFDISLPHGEALHGQAE